MTGQEIEAKFYVRSLKMVERRLQGWQARLIQPRGLEVNRRFDLPDGSLKARGRVLRLRKDTELHLTYKDSSKLDRGVLTRRELEITVSDMDSAQEMLGALGYIQSAVYEKYRTVYEAGECHVMLDELPIGDFVEIEGPDADSIRVLAAKLGLKIESAVPQSYLALFERFCLGRPFAPDQMTFEALKGVKVRGEALGVDPADE